MKNAGTESVTEIIRNGIEKKVNILHTERNQKDSLNLNYAI